LKLNVADAYVKVLRATQAVQLAASSVAGLTAQSQNVEAFFAKDFVAKNDLLASRVVLVDARQREIQARNGLDLAGASYNRFLVRPLTYLAGSGGICRTGFRSQLFLAGVDVPLPATQFSTYRRSRQFTGGHQDA
jgi:outer membrane protein TolC